MIELTDAIFDNIVATTPGLMIVDFYTTWCGPCKMQTPILEKVAQSHPVIVAKIDLESNPVTGTKFRVSKIPTLLFMKDGREVKRMVGVQREAILIKEIESLK